MSTGRLIIGLLVIFLGLNILFNLDLFRIIIPLIIIYIGIRILTRGSTESKNGGKSQSNENFLDRVLVFSGMDKKYVADDFEGGRIVAVFSGAEIDLSQVKTKSEKLTLELVAVFGGIKARVPQNWQVRSEGVGILGGFNDETRASGKNPVDVKIKGAAVFGGVDIVN